MKFQNYIIALLVSLCLSCHKETIVPIDEVEETPIVETKYETSVYGVVVDENHKPVERATIYLAGQSLVTDKSGLFRFNKINLGLVYGASVKAIAQGYISSGSTLYADDLGNYFTQVELVKSQKVASLNTNTGGKVNLQNGCVIEFPADGIWYKNSSYKGNFNVFAKYFDPKSDKFLAQLPGDLTGFNDKKSYVSLLSHGVLNVELVGENGEPLQLDSTKGVKIIWPAPDGFPATSSIQLWYFDNNKNKWLVESSASLINNHYEGVVKHFSWWNLALPNDGVSLTLKLIRINDSQPLQNHKVSLTSKVYSTAYGVTNAKGVINGRIPKGEVLIMKVYNNCNEVAYEKEIGPFTNLYNETAILVPITGDNYFTIKGTVSDCTLSTPVQGIFIKIDNGLLSQYSISDNIGHYEFTNLYCGSQDIKITAVDVANKKGVEVDLNNILPLPYSQDLIMCDLTELIELKQDGKTIYGSVQCKSRLRPNEAIIQSTDQAFLLGFKGSGVGTFPANLSFTDGIAEAKDCNVTISLFSNQYMEGTFQGNGTMLSNPKKKVFYSGTFVAKIL